MNLEPVTDVLDHRQRPGLRMEYIDGPALNEVLAQHRPSLEEALQIFRAVLSAVDHAHNHGLVHRDLKPGNVLLQVEASRVVAMYSMGCILYELVCGCTPFPQADLLAMFAAISEGRYQPPEERTPGLPEAVAATIEALLQGDRDDRPASCSVALAMLDGSAPPVASTSGWDLWATSR